MEISDLSFALDFKNWTLKRLASCIIVLIVNLSAIIGVQMLSIDEISKVIYSLSFTLLFVGLIILIIIDLIRNVKKVIYEQKIEELEEMERQKAYSNKWTRHDIEKQYGNFNLKAPRWLVPLVILSLIASTITTIINTNDNSQLIVVLIIMLMAVVLFFASRN